MLIGKIIILVVRFTLSLQHYIPPPDPCLQAKFCNHTWHEECGIETTDLNKRRFLDLCDMYEYNCDYDKGYSRIDLTECQYNCTSHTTTMTPSSPTMINTITSTETMTAANGTTTAFTLVSSQTTTMIASTTTISSSNITLNAITTEVPVTVIDTQYTTLLFVSTTEKSMTNESISTNSPTTESFVITINNSTIVDTIVDNPNTTQNSYITTSENITLVVSSVVTEQVSSILTILNNSTTEANNITINENTIPHSTVNTVSEILESNKNKNIHTISSPNDTCSVYPDDCDRPKTWETTVKGERRDFFQIMRDRFGINAVALEDTTHGPRRAYREKN